MSFRILQWKREAVILLRLWDTREDFISHHGVIKRRA